MRASAPRRPRLLLINPRFPESFWSFRWGLEKILTGKRALNPPLGLATLAALCPPHWDVRIVDENVEPVPLEPEADIVGVCGMAVQFPRQRELLAYYRRPGCHVVAGGSFASLCPERFAGLADTVVAGEAEYIWPQFCRDFEQGAARAEYRETGTVSLEDSPVPRFDLLALERYTSVSLQFSRGCPFRCDFCDIIVMFGRQPRSKRPEQIGRELDLLRARGVKSVFFVDDNLIGNKKTAKELLRYLAEYQSRHGYAFRFGTEASINLADDPELLRLFRAANFAWVFIGIESPDAASLQETNKTQNLKRDLLSAIHTVYANGIDVLAGFIVGFDNDTLETFERQRRFIERSGIQVAMVGLLTALPRTPLYQRLQREGRLLEDTEHGDNTRLGTNFVPKRMEYDAMVRAYHGLYRRLFSDAGIARRIRAKTRHLRAPSAEYYSLAERLGIVRRLLVHGVSAGGVLWPWHLVRTLALARPRTWPQVLTDWIAGLSMREYIRRRLVIEPAADRRAVGSTAERLRRRFAADVRRGVIEIGAPGGADAELHIRVRAGVGARFFRRTGHRLEQMLQRSAAGLALSIEALHAEERRHLERLLARLAPYGDRVSVWIDERIRPLVAIDSSVFRLRLAPPAGAPVP